MRKLSEFKSVTDLPFNEEIEIDTLFDAPNHRDMLFMQLELMIRPMNGTVVSYEKFTTGRDTTVFTLRVPEEYIPKPEIKPATMDFSQALIELKAGKAVRLPSWKEDVRIKCMFPKEGSDMTAPYLYVESRFGKVPWKETMIELFASDWMIVEP